MEEFMKWLRNAPWSIWFGRFLAIMYPLILGIKFTYALTISGVFPLPVIFLLASIATVFNMACFWLVVPYLCKKLFSENLTDETIKLKIDGKEETFKVMHDGKNVKVTWRARLMIYAVSVGVMVTAIGTAGIAIAAFIPTLTGFGLHGIAHLSAASTVSLFAPLAVIIIISYAALALKDVTELLSREDLKETMKRNIRTALGRDAAEKFPEDLQAQQRYKHRQWAILALGTVFVGLGILGTFATATIGLEIVTKAFSMTAAEPFLVAYAVVSMTPFLWSTLYQFSQALFNGYDATVKLYNEELLKQNATPVSAMLTCVKYYFVKAIWSAAFYVGMGGMVNAFCQGFIASLHYPDLHELSTKQQTVAGLSISGPTLKYLGLSNNTAQGWHNRGIALTKIISIEKPGIKGTFSEEALMEEALLDKPSLKPVNEFITHTTPTSNVFFLTYQDGKAIKKDAMPALKEAGFMVTPEGHIKKQYGARIA